MDPILGQIIIFAGNFAPRGWAFCDGQLMAISSNPALYSLLGTYYGGDGRSTFALPDLRGRMPMHAGTGPGLSPRMLGQRAGTESTVLSTYNLPSHTHTATIVGGSAHAQAQVNANSGKGTESSPGGNYWSAGGDYSSTSNTTMAADAVNVRVDLSGSQVQVGNTGGNQAFNNMPPFLVMNYIICLNGTYPSRS